MEKGQKQVIFFKIKKNVEMNNYTGWQSTQVSSVQHCMDIVIITQMPSQSK